jgi:hypothetical protein
MKEKRNEKQERERERNMLGSSDHWTGSAALSYIGSFFLFFLSDVAVRNQDEEDTAIRPRERRK